MGYWLTMMVHSAAVPEMCMVAAVPLAVTDCRCVLDTASEEAWESNSVMAGIGACSFDRVPEPAMTPAAHPSASEYFLAASGPVASPIPRWIP